MAEWEMGGRSHECREKGGWEFVVEKLVTRGI